MRWLIPMVVLIGCDAPSEPQRAALEASSPPPSLTVSWSGLATRGGMLTLVATAPSAPDGTQGYIALSEGGLGPGDCPPALLGQCLGLLGTTHYLGPATFLGGEASLIWTIPLTAPATLGVQATVRHAGRVVLSNAEAIQVEGGILGQNEVCNRTPNACDAGLSCCYPCGVQGCENRCTPTCSPRDIACFDGCYAYP